MQFFSRWRASQDEEESSQAFHEDGSRVLDGADIDPSIDPAEQHRRDRETRRAQAQVLESARPRGEGVGAGSSQDVSGSSPPRRVGFEPGLVKGPAAAQDLPPVRKPSSGAAAESQDWRWLLQQEELNSLAELSSVPPAPQTAAEANAARRQAAEELDLSSVKREELHLLSAEELGALDEL